MSSFEKSQKLGGGESALVDDLLSHGFRNITVLDISQTAIEVNKRRLAERADHVHWLVADITKAELPKSAYDVWHDRAVFHFLTQRANVPLAFGKSHTQSSPVVM